LYKERNWGAQGTSFYMTLAKKRQNKLFRRENGGKLSKLTRK
jgi:hypothetical protein